MRANLNTLLKRQRVEAGLTVAAAAAAAKLRGEIADMVAGWEKPGDDSRPTGYSNEVAAWAHAANLANGATYGADAGVYIAEQAVELEEIADDGRIG
mgnify:CR=1 FL=1